MHSSFSSDGKNVISPARTRPAYAFAPRVRPSSQEYPIFTPSFEEFVLGSSFPPESSDDSIEALRDEEVLSPLVLGRTDSRGFRLDPSVHPFYGMAQAGRSAANYKAADPFVQRKKIESRPHRITSIHPNRMPVYKPRNRSEEFSRQAQADWEVPPPQVINKKPLSEFLNDIALKKSHSTYAPPTDTQISQDSTTTDASTVKKQQLVGPDSRDISGCLACDKCLPGGRVTVVPLMDSRDYTELPPKDRDFTESGVPKKTSNHSLLSWFRSKKKPCDTRERISSKAQASQGQLMDHDRSMHVLSPVAVKDMPTPAAEEIKDMEMTVNSLKLEASQANQKRDAALVEVFELKLAIEEMGKKMEHLEEYCQNLNVGTEKPTSKTMALEEYGNQRKEEELAKLSPPGSARFGPTKKDFYHAVTEARIGVKQFCRTLLQQIQEQSAVEKIESILQPYNVRVAPRVSKSVRYHIESLINQAFYEDFENIKFQRSGTNCVLDPMQRPQAFFKTYLTISQIGWSELVTKGSSAYSESFDGFCDFKMNRVEEVLNWDGRWPDELARAFFVAAKWVWLLHLLAFSFENPAIIFRVGTEAHFDNYYMEELPVDQSARFKQHSNGVGVEGSPHIRAMVMPGFFFTSYDVIKCKVILSRQPFAPS